MPDLSIDEILLLLLEQIHRLGATRVVLDSLSGLELALAPTFRDDFRESLSRLATALSAEGVSVLMTSELEDRYSDLRFSPYGTAFMTDAIIVHRYIESGAGCGEAGGGQGARECAFRRTARVHDRRHGTGPGAMLAGQEGLLGGRPTRPRAIPPPAERGPTDG